MQSYFKVLRYVRLNSTHFLMKIPNKGDQENIANIAILKIFHSADIDFKDFTKIYKKCTEEKYYFLDNDANDTIR